MIERLQFSRNVRGIMDGSAHSTLDAEDRGLDMGCQRGEQNIVLQESNAYTFLHEGDQMFGKAADAAGVHLILACRVRQTGTH